MTNYMTRLVSTMVLNLSWYISQILLSQGIFDHQQRYDRCLQKLRQIYILYFLNSTPTYRASFRIFQHETICTISAQAYMATRLYNYFNLFHQAYTAATSFARWIVIVHSLFLPSELFSELFILFTAFLCGLEPKQSSQCSK